MGSAESPGSATWVKELFFFVRDQKHGADAATAKLRLAGPPLPPCQWSVRSRGLPLRVERNVLRRALQLPPERAKRLALRLMREPDLVLPEKAAPLRAALQR